MSGMHDEHVKHFLLADDNSNDNESNFYPRRENTKLSTYDIEKSALYLLHTDIFLPLTLKF